MSDWSIIIAGVAFLIALCWRDIARAFRGKR